MIDRVRAKIPAAFASHVLSVESILPVIPSLTCVNRAPNQHLLAADGDDNITLRGIAVASYPHFGSMFGDH